MTDRTPHPFPDIIDQPFPTEIPWDRPISELSGWWIEHRCQHNHVGAYPLKLLAAQMGWEATLKQIAPRIVSKHCGERPVVLELVDTPQGDEGRHGAKAKRLSLL
jgi:hypothetical protein